MDLWSKSLCAIGWGLKRMFVYTLMLAISSLPSSKPTHMLSLCFFSLFGIHAEIRGHKVFRGPLSTCSPIPVPTPPPIQERERERESGERERDKERGRMLRQDHKNRAMCYRDNKVPPAEQIQQHKVKCDQASTEHQGYKWAQLQKRQWLIVSGQGSWDTGMFVYKNVLEAALYYMSLYLQWVHAAKLKKPLLFQRRQLFLNLLQCASLKLCPWQQTTHSPQ